MSNFTPGPWEVVKDEVLGFIIPHPTEKALLIARVPNKANAVAIAAVPEMVELIKEFVPVMPIDEEVVQEQYIKLSKRASALLRRIEGEEETDEL